MLRSLFPGSSHSKKAVLNAGDPGLTLGLRRSSGEGDGNPLQYSCLEDSMDRGALVGCSSWGSQRVGHD